MNSKRAKKLKRKSELGREMYVYLLRLRKPITYRERCWFSAMYQYYKKRLLTEGYLFYIKEY